MSDVPIKIEINIFLKVLSILSTYFYTFTMFLKTRYKLQTTGVADIPDNIQKSIHILKWFVTI